MKVIKISTDSGLMAVRADAITRVEPSNDWQRAVIKIVDDPKKHRVENTGYDEFVQLWIDALAN